MAASFSARKVASSALATSAAAEPARAIAVAVRYESACGKKGSVAKLQRCHS